MCLKPCASFVEQRVLIVSSPPLHIQKGLLVLLHDLPDTQRLDNVTVEIVNMMQSFRPSMECLGYQKLQSGTWFDCVTV